MKYFNNRLLGLLTAGTVAICFNASTIQSYAQSEESANPSEDVLIISELPDAEGGHIGHEPWPEKLGLTDEQMEQLVSLKSEYAVDTAKQKAELKADMGKMMLLMTAPTLDKQAVLSLKEKMDQLKASLCDARVNHMISAMNVMTPKQKEQMRHHMLVHMLSHHHSMGHGPHAHKGGMHKEHHSA
jgi:Spy/CpxP family protein refolding chaperone